MDLLQLVKHKISQSETDRHTEGASLTCGSGRTKRQRQ